MHAFRAFNPEATCTGNMFTPAPECARRRRSAYSFGVTASGAAFGYLAGSGGTLAHTRDGGTSWTLYLPSLPSSLFCIHVCVHAQLPAPPLHSSYGRTAERRERGRRAQAWDEQRVWAVGAGGSTVRSDDAGATWTATTVGSASLYAVHFISAQEGYAAGAGGLLLRTFNGGSLWSQVCEEARLRCHVCCVAVRAYNHPRTIQRCPCRCVLSKFPS